MATGGVKFISTTRCNPRVLVFPLKRPLTPRFGVTLTSKEVDESKQNRFESHWSWCINDVFSSEERNEKIGEKEVS